MLPEVIEKLRKWDDSGTKNRIRMKQLTQKLKTGKMQILEASIPAMGKGQVLVRNFYSLISAGTEGSTVKTARKDPSDQYLVCLAGL